MFIDAWQYLIVPIHGEILPASITRCKTALSCRRPDGATPQVSAVGSIALQL
jgi:hypothetical protein